MVVFNRVARLAERGKLYVRQVCYQRSSERRLRLFTGRDENEVIWAIAEMVRAEFVKFDQELPAAPEPE